MYVTLFQRDGRPFKVEVCDINDTIETCVLRIEDRPGFGFMLAFHMDNLNAARALGEAIVKAVERHEQTLTENANGEADPIVARACGIS